MWQDRTGVDRKLDEYPPAVRLTLGSGLQRWRRARLVRRAPRTMLVDPTERTPFASPERTGLGYWVPHSTRAIVKLCLESVGSSMKPILTCLSCR